MQLMIVVREVFVAKPGQASKLASLMKEIAQSGLMGKCRIMTDLTGDFNRVVMETEFESLAEVEIRMQENEKNDAVRQKMKGYTEMYLTGGREVFRVWT
jgi:HKD family nuclease